MLCLRCTQSFVSVAWRGVAFQKHSVSLGSVKVFSGLSGFCYCCSSLLLLWFVLCWRVFGCLLKCRIHLARPTTAYRWAFLLKTPFHLRQHLKVLCRVPLLVLGLLSHRGCGSGKRKLHSRHNFIDPEKHLLAGFFFGSRRFC